MAGSSASRRARLWVATGAVVAVCIAAVLAVVVLRLGIGATNASPTPTSTTAVQAHDAARALSKLASNPEELVASSAQSVVAGRARDAVPPGSKVAPDEESWAPDGLGGGTMYVSITPPGQPARDYFAVMTQEKGQWKVMATVPATGKQ